MTLKEQTPRMLDIVRRFPLLLLLLGSLVLGACNIFDDDDDEDADTDFVALDEPAYAEDAAVYTILDSNSDIASIQLMEGGDYIITTQSSAAKATRANGTGIICGTYVKSDDFYYTLNDYGTLKIVWSDNSCRLSLYREGIDYTYTNINVNNYRSTVANYTKKDLTLCRRWNMTRIVCEGADYEEGYSYSFDATNLRDLYRQAVLFASKYNQTDFVVDSYEEMESEWEFPVTYSFSLVGTMIATYASGAKSSGSWRGYGSVYRVQLDQQYLNEDGDEFLSDFVVNLSGRYLVYSISDSDSEESFSITIYYTSE